MPIDIGAALRNGYERTVARNGLLFVVILYVISLLNGLITRSLIPQTMPTGMGGPGPGMGPGPGVAPAAPSLGLSPIVAGILSLLLAIVSLLVTVAAVRTFVSDETERIPEEYFTHNIVWAVLNLIIGGIIFGIVLAIGFVLLIIPGLFLLVSLFFWNIYVIVEDQSFIEGFRNSWALTGGHRLRLFFLGLIVAVISIVINLVFGIPGIVLPGIIGFLIAQIGSAFIGVFTSATVAQTYNQLTAMEATESA